MQGSQSFGQADVFRAAGFDQVIGQRGNVQHVAFHAERHQASRLFSKCLVGASSGEFSDQVQVTQMGDRDQAVTVSQNGRVPRNFLAGLQTAWIRIKRGERVDDLSKVRARAAVNDVQVVDLFSQAVSLRRDAAANEEFHVRIDQRLQQLTGKFFVLRKGHKLRHWLQ